MQSAATRNERAGLVGHRDVTDVTGEQGVNVTETDVPGSRIITESVAGQVRRPTTPLNSKMRELHFLNRCNFIFVFPKV